MPRFARVSPDGRRVVFESLGKLYVKSLPDGAPRRLTRAGGDFELFPSWSYDGRRIVYVSWNDQELGTIRTVSAGGGTGRAITREPGHYRRPRFSPDGRTIVFEKDAGGYLTSEDWSEAPGIYRMPATGGDVVRVATSGSFPHFANTNDRIFMTTFDGDKASLVSVDRSGEDERVHASGELITSMQVAPSGDHLAFAENYSAFVMPMTAGPQKIAAGSGASAVTVTKASGVGVTYFNWSRGRLNWSLGATLFGADVADMLPSAPKDEDGDESYAPPETGTDLSMSFDADKPSGLTALTNARVITMADDDGGVIEEGLVIIDGNRIQAVGAMSDLEIPAGARVVDLAGKTIIPGIIDAHAHGPQGSDDLIPEQNWSAIAHLALGVTTIHDPSNTGSHIFAAAEYQRAGRIIAPRIYSTGRIVYGAKSPGFYAVVDSLEDARNHVRRLKAEGAHSVKNYNQPRRDQRQQVNEAAREENMMVVAEGGSLFHMDMSFVADGVTSIEHNLPAIKAL